MSAILIPGQTDWNGGRDSDGHRTYTVRHLVQAAVTDGPAVVMNVSGIPDVGDPWDISGDSDSAAFCYPDLQATPLNTHEKNRYWYLTQKFSTRPLRRCQTAPITDPLLEPAEISGSFTTYMKEITKDRFGSEITNTAHERLRGQLLQFPHKYLTVNISHNTANLEIDLLDSMIHHVNEDVLWGFDAREVLLEGISWTRRVYGLCDYFFTRNYVFLIDTKYHHDRRLLNEGEMVLHGRWKTSGDRVNYSDTPIGGSDEGWDVGTGSFETPANEWVLTNINGVKPDYTNPAHFIRAFDRLGNPARILLNLRGEPLAKDEDPVEIEVEYYDEADFLELGIPTELDP